jgi:hypothetical protein
VVVGGQETTRSCPYSWILIADDSALHPPYTILASAPHRRFARTSSTLPQMSSSAEAETQKSVGNDAYRRGDYTAAIAAFARATELSPAHAVYWSNLSAAQVRGTTMRRVYC